jgi:hypothetical protein
LAEWLFAFLPLVTVGIVLAHVSEGSWSDVWESPEWSFGACVLAGQGVVRFVWGVAHARRVSLERALLGISLLVVGMVGPTQAILVLCLIDYHASRHLTAALTCLQIIAFVVASVAYLLIAAAAHLVAAKKNQVRDEGLEPAEAGDSGPYFANATQRRRAQSG